MSFSSCKARRRTNGFSSIWPPPYRMSHASPMLFQTSFAAHQKPDLEVKWSHSLIGWWVKSCSRLTARVSSRPPKQLIIVTSDNGAKPGDYNCITYGHKSCSDLRGFKSGICEGDPRVPMVVHWPQTVKLGQISDQLVVLHDFMATAADLHAAGRPAPRQTARVICPS